jgi:hypothetical protein
VAVSIDLAIVVVEDPTRFSVEDMVSAAKQTYGAYGIDLLVNHRSAVTDDEFQDLDVNGCRRGAITREQSDLFSHRPGEGIHAYFVRSTVLAYNGCSAHAPQQPSLVIVSDASRWTLAHELGHVMGLSHVIPLDRLMTGQGTDLINATPPHLANDEIRQIMSSEYVRGSGAK